MANGSHLSIYVFPSLSIHFHISLHRHTASSVDKDFAICSGHMCPTYAFHHSDRFPCLHNEQVILVLRLNTFRAHQIH